jgi:hypothetical protein
VTDSLFPRLIRALDLAVIERQPNGQFQLLTPAPPWLEKAFDRAPAGGRATLDGAFPFLEDVVHQALGAWQAGPHASMVFGPFSATVEGDELLLRATALTIDGRTLLVIDRLIGAADTRPLLQKARERMLESESLVRAVTALHAPVAAVDRTATALTGSALSADQRALADALGRAVGELKSAVARLPAPPSRRRR